MSLMKPRLTRIAFLVALSLIGLRASAAQAQTTLRWKLKPGDRLIYVLTQNAATKMAVKDTTFETKMTQTTDMTWRVKAVDGAGNAELAETIDRIRMKVEGGPVGLIDYDSKAAKKPAGPIGQVLAPILDAVVGVEFVVKISPQGEISDVKIPEKMTAILKDMPGADKLGDLFSEEGIKRLTGASGFVLPKEAVSKGKTWTNEARMKMPFAVVKADNEFTYEGPAKRDGRDVEQIGMKTVMSMEPLPESKLQFKLKSKDAKGATYFDNAAGRIVESDMTQKMTMTFSVAGQSAEQQLETEVNLNMKLADGAEKQKTN